MLSVGSVHGCLALALTQNIMVAGASGRGSSLPHGTSQTNRDLGQTRAPFPPQGHTPSDLLPPVRPGLLKFLEPPKIESPAGK